MSLIATRRSLQHLSVQRVELDFKIDATTDEAERIAQALEVVPPTLSVQKDEFGYPIASDEETSDEEA